MCLSLSMLAYDQTHIVSFGTMRTIDATYLQNIPWFCAFHNKDSISIYFFLNPECISISFKFGGK